MMYDYCLIKQKYLRLHSHANVHNGAVKITFNILGENCLIETLNFIERLYWIFLNKETSEGSQKMRYAAYYV